MTIQDPEMRRATTCPHCEGWPLSDERDTGGAPLYVCTNCGCGFSPVGLALVAAGDGCPVAAMEEGE